MPQLLLELFSEEIPARMQAQAARDLERLIVGGLTERGFLNEGARGFATPRRLTLVIEGLPAEQADMREERKGPKVAAPDQAIQGFLRSTGLTREQLKVQKDPRGDFYLAVTERKGRPTPDVLAELIPDVIKAFPWPKSQRWGAGELTWVRPLHSILCTFDGEIVPFTVGAVKSSNTTRGHRFLGNDKFDVRRFDDYVDKLKRAHVILNAAERKAAILHEAKQLAHAQNLSLIEDDALADEVAGLVEWPIALIGQFDKPFLDVPQEILISTMRANQKYFALKDPATGKLANKFVVIANMITKDGGKNVVTGNERVLRARLSDAKFFWDQDKKRKLESRVSQLDDIVFHERLGSQSERVANTASITVAIAGAMNLDEAQIKDSERAAKLSKADLVTGTVGEFPEVQGIMGRYFALHDKESAQVADAIRDHYKPLGPGDQVAAAPTTVALALADKLNTLVGFFSFADERPTRSKDPYALRRAALGVVRTVLENQVRLPLRDILANVWAVQMRTFDRRARLQEGYQPGPLMDDDELLSTGKQDTGAVLEFLIDRLKVALRDRGIRHDLIDAVFALEGQDDLVLIVRRVEALQAFLKTDDGANLLAGYRRAVNILKIEEKKDQRKYDTPVDIMWLSEDEKELYSAACLTRQELQNYLDAEDFKSAMKWLSGLRSRVDAFFEKVTVNVDKPELRANRLKLLSEIRVAMHTVADFSKIEG